MKYKITQLVNQKQEFEEKLAKSTTSVTSVTSTQPLFPTKPLFPAKINNIKLAALSSPNLKKPNPASPKFNVKYIPHTTPKEALNLKTPAFIKFNQIQIKKIESENLNTSSSRQNDIT
jgi:hypothetical protein